MESQLCAAARTGDVDLVRRLLLNGDDVNQLDMNGQSALGIVVEALVANFGLDSHVAIFEMLLDYGADIERADSQRLSPLWLASSAGRLDLVSRLVGHPIGAVVSAPFIRTPPAAAVSFSPRRTTVRPFTGLQSWQPPPPPSQPPRVESSWTPMMSAAVRRHLAVVRLLISTGRGGAVHDVDSEGNTLLHLLLRHSTGRPSPDDERRVLGAVNDLLAAIDNDLDSTVNALNEVGVSALFWAAERVMPNVCRSLVDCGANPNLGSTTGSLPLTAACAADDLDTVDVLLLAGADPNGEALLTDWPKKNGAVVVPDHDFDRFTRPDSLPITVALHGKDVRVLTRLVAAGADVNRLDDDGLLPLHRAVERAVSILSEEAGMEDDADQLMDVDVDGLQTGANDGRSTCRDRWKQMIDILLYAGADPNGRACLTRHTPLRHLAAFCQFSARGSVDRLSAAVLAVFSALAERHDCLNASLPDDDDENYNFQFHLSDLLVYSDRPSTDMLLRLLCAGVGPRMLTAFYNATNRHLEGLRPVSVELCVAFVELTGYQVGSEDIARLVEVMPLYYVSRSANFADLSKLEREYESQETLLRFKAWLEDRQRNPPCQPLKQLCRIFIRRQLLAANGPTSLGLLIDELLPDFPGLNKYLKGIQL